MKIAPKLAQEVRFALTRDGVRIAYAVTGAGPILVRAPHWLTHLEYDWSMAPDGKTLMATASAPITVAAFQKLEYDPLKDFTPVSLAAMFHLALAVGPGSPAKTFSEYMAWARSDETRQSYGTAAAGSIPHMLGSLLARETGIPFNHVPYNGGAPLPNALAGGHIPAGIMLVSEALPLHQGRSAHPKSSNA